MWELVLGAVLFGTRDSTRVRARARRRDEGETRKGDTNEVNVDIRCTEFAFNGGMHAMEDDRMRMRFETRAFRG